MAAMKGRETRPTNGQDHERLSPCVWRTPRMVSRAVTQLYDNLLRPSGLRVTQVSILATIARLGEANLRQLEYMLAIDQTTLTRSLNRLERDRVIERVPHPDWRCHGRAQRPAAAGNGDRASNCPGSLMRAGLSTATRLLRSHPSLLCRTLRHGQAGSTRTSGGGKRRSGGPVGFAQPRRGPG
jgi:MarR family protein